VARKIVVLCDICNDRGEEVQSDDTKEIKLGRGKPRLLDLCTRCKGEWYDPFAEMVLKLGIVSDDASGTQVDDDGRERKYTCPVPGCKNERGFLRLATRNEHLRKSHAGVADKYLPLANKRVDCPFPECDEEPQGNRGLVQHVRQAHPKKYKDWYAAFKANNGMAPQLDVVQR
jgi:hypothetical protein